MQQWYLENKSVVYQMDDRMVKLDACSGALCEFTQNGRGIRLKTDAMYITVDHEEVDLFSLPAELRLQENGVEWHYVGKGFRAELQYCLNEVGALQRSLCFHSGRNGLIFESVRTAEECVNGYKKALPYHVFWNAPLGCFVRDGEDSWITGFENPFFEMNPSGSTVEMDFQTGLIMQAEEVCACEPQFFVLYQPSGQMLTDHADRFAFLPSKDEGRDRCRFRNPDGHIPLDRMEIQAMRTYIEHYLETPQRNFITILYMYWLPIKQMPDCDADVKQYKRVLSSFKRLGGEMVVFNPLFRYSFPSSGDDACWEIAPEGSYAAKVLQYADSLGLKYGFYMGVAAHGAYGNAAALPFRPDMKCCKKRFADGSLSSENCLASDEHLDWWLKIQMNTIEQYHLSYWSWDPGPGNGTHCFSSEHGHLPGKGAYRGFQNSQKLLKALRERYPDLYLMSFYGRKELGPWGFKYFDQQESYWEQTPVICSTLHPDLHDDRMNAHGVRMQSAWNQMFRFLPPRINHVLVHRICEHYHSPELTSVWDADGWKYALLSGIALSASLTIDLLPEKETVLEQMIPFYRKWLTWAKEHITSINSLIPFGGYAEAGMYDGVARIEGGRGHIFLFNASPLRLNGRLVLDETIDFTGRSCSIRMMYPMEGAMLYNTRCQSGVFSKGDSVEFCLEPYGVQVLSLVDEMESLLYGLPGNGELDESGRLSWCAPALEKGIYYPVSTAQHVTSLQINHQPVPLGTGVTAGSQGVIKRSLMRFQREDGSDYPLMNNQAEKKILLKSSFVIENGLRKRTAALSKLDDPVMLAKMEHWRKRKEQSDFHNFLWAEQGRALLVIHTRTCCGVKAMRVWVDDTEIPADAFLLDQKPLFLYARLPNECLEEGYHALRIELEELQAAQFMGAWLEFAPLGKSDQFVAARPLNDAIVCEMKEKDNQGESPIRICNATLTRDRVYADGDEIGVYAGVTAAADAVDALYVENPTLPVATRLLYDPQMGLFSAQVPIGSRQSNIMDAEAFYVFGVDKEGRRIPSVRLPFSFSSR